MKLDKFYTRIFYRHVYDKIMNEWLVSFYNLPDTIHNYLRRFLHKFDIHWYYAWSSQCLNFLEMDRLEDWQKYSFRKCKLCDKEMPYSRHFYKIGVKEKNAREYEN